MKVLIIGGGGREHALAWKISQSPVVKKIYVAPGNGGTALDNNIENIDITDVQELISFSIKQKIDLVIVGPEKPLVEGIVDYLEKYKIKVFGPNQIASQLEGSKIFTKNLCKKYKIPTAKFGVFNKKEDAKNFIEKSKYPLVVKLDRLGS